MGNKIKYVKHKYIDKQLWDNCVNNSVNRFIYAQSWYLDIISENWDAIIYDNYSAVMPVIWKKKYRLRYVYQPIYMQQTGIFFTEKLTISEILKFIEIVNKKFLKIDINFNYANKLPKNISFKIRTNYILDLNCTYENLYSNFNKNTKRNIKKAQKKNLTIVNNATAEEHIEFKKLNLESDVPDFVFTRFKKIINYCKQNNCAEQYLVKNEKEEIISSVFLPIDGNRIYYLQATSNNEGKSKAAAFMIINTIIEKYAGTNIVLDFEGSMIPGVARFFHGWGAVQQNYFHYSHKMFPIPNFLIKK